MASNYSVDDEMAVTPAVENIRTNLQVFSDAMISVYKESQKLDARVGKASEIKKITNLIAQDATHYAKDVVPTCHSVVKSLDNFFDLYQDLTEEQWLEYLEYVSRKAEECAKGCHKLAEEHTQILGKLKSTKIETEILETDIEELIKDNKRSQIEFEKEANVNSTKAFRSALVPIIGIPFMMHYARKREEAENKARQQGRNVVMNSSSLHIVQEKMIPALQAFINALNVLASFFSKYEASLSNWTKKAIDDPPPSLKSHYTYVKEQYKHMKRACNSFYIDYPDIRSNLLAIEH